MSRRRLLGVLALGTAAPVAGRGDTGEGPALDAIDTLSAEAAVRLAAIAVAWPRAAAFASSASADLARHRHERRAEQARAPKPEQPASLPRLRAALEALMYAHAEALPAIANRSMVRRLAEHMVDLSRLLTVVDLWLESEDPGE